jgi:DNA-binding MarR family transcriptional regulator
MKKIRQLHDALLRLGGFLNRPQADAALMKEAGIALDRALFPLLVRVEREGPIGVVGLADLVGRDYTTVSRQTAKLEAIGLIAKKTNKADRRVTELVATAKGRSATTALDAARERLAAPVLAQWPEQDVKDFIRLLRKFVEDAEQRIGEVERRV